MLEVVKNNVPDTRANVAELFADFINYLDVAEKTADTYKKALKQFFMWLNNNGINRPVYADIKAYKAHLNNGGYKAASVSAYLSAVRRFFTWTAAEGLYPNVAEGIKGAKMDKTPKKDYLTATQVKTVIGEIDTDTVKGLRNAAIITLMVTCGLRTVEVMRANVDDLRTLGNETVLYVQGKGKDDKSDFVIVPSKAEAAIRKYLKARGNTAGALFTSTSNNNAGERMTTRSISAIAKEAMQTAGYDSDRLTAHSLRHTAVTLSLIANGGNIQEAAQFARHANIATTTIYAHNLQKLENKCSRAINDMI